MSFAPDEPPEFLLVERLEFGGILLEAVAYGLHVAVFFQALYHMIRTPPKKSISWPFVAFISVLFGLGTVNFAVSSRFLQMMWIDDRNFPGGPIAFKLANTGGGLNSAADASLIIANALADAVLVYRLFVVWNKSYYVAFLPFLTLLASISLSVVSVVQLIHPNTTVLSHSAVQFEIPYTSLSTALNIVLSLGIAYRILRMRQLVITSLGKEHAEVYVSIAAMVVESAAVYTAASIFFLVCIAMESDVQFLALQIVSQVVCIAPELIVLRVAQGRAWNTRTNRAVSSFNAAVPDSSRTRVGEEHQQDLETGTSQTSLGQVSVIRTHMISKDKSDIERLVGEEEKGEQ